MTETDEAVRTPLHRRIAPRHGALLALLAATALLYTWNLSRNGWGNEFYAAAAQAGGESWKAWLFGSLDWANSITVDKPPAALWVTGLSVRIFGLSSWSVLMPQAIMGVLSVALIYATVRRVLLSAGSDRTATAGGLLAGAVLALTPAAVLIFRFNNPDALLVLLMTAAAYATVRACQAASWKWLALVGVALGFAFLTKMLQGLLVLPGFALAYLLFAQTGWLKRIRDLLIAAVALIVSAGWYAALVDLWPKDSRPYIGGSTDNTFMDLVLGYNGLSRITGGSGGGMGGGPGGSGSTGGSFGGDPSLARLFSNEFGNEISWLLPAALLVLVAAMAVGFVKAFRQWRRTPLADDAGHVDRDVAVALTVFGTWLVVTGIVFSFMGGIVHPYYTVALAPAIAAVVGIGAITGWRNRRTWTGTAFLALLLISATGWGMIRAARTDYAWPVLGWVLGAATVIGLIGLVLLHGSTGRRAVSLATTLVVAGGIAVSSFGIATAGTTHTGSIPTAVITGSGTGMGGPGGGGPGGGGPGGARPDGNQTDGARPDGNQSDGNQSDGNQSDGQTGSGMPGGMGGGGMGGPGGMVDDEVIALLKKTDTTWAAAVNGAQSASGLQLEAGKPIMAIGGWSGDPSPTLKQFQQWVKEGKIGYYVTSGNGGGRGGPGGSSEIAAWVSENFTAVTVGNSTVYKLN
ncbi:ArnT family glycosyltransferase [Gordonia sp. VNK21]|uniref:ArnT family glycosyltransferase n=1 Tax=Gordonia sp. VNK21 TaxID=3382483 RepID=UPI0038D4AEFD